VGALFSNVDSPGVITAWETSVDYFYELYPKAAERNHDFMFFYDFDEGLNRLVTWSYNIGKLGVDADLGDITRILDEAEPWLSAIESFTSSDVVDELDIDYKYSSDLQLFRYLQLVTAFEYKVKEIESHLHVNQLIVNHLIKGDPNLDSARLLRLLNGLTSVDKLIKLVPKIKNNKIKIVFTHDEIEQFFLAYCYMMNYLYIDLFFSLQKVVQTPQMQEAIDKDMREMFGDDGYQRIIESLEKKD
jgi:predicted XRE-type DNA-binding protein